jgi:hypothetical protein
MGKNPFIPFGNQGVCRNERDLECLNRFDAQTVI